MKPTFLLRLGVQFQKIEGGIPKAVLFDDNAAPCSGLLNAIFNQREITFG